MYCRKCGKELPADSNFCPNCGASQKEATSGLKNQIVTFYYNHKKVSRMYLAWLVLHVFLLLLANPQEQDPPRFSRWEGPTTVQDIKEEFFPFGYYGVDSYDVSEFFFYTIVFPIILYSLYKLLSYGFAGLRKLFTFIFIRRKGEPKSNQDTTYGTTNEKMEDTSTPSIVVAKSSLQPGSPDSELSEEEVTLKETMPLTSENSETGTIVEDSNQIEMMPLLRRFFGSIIDKVFLLVFFFLTCESNPFLQSGDIGGYIGIIDKSPLDYRMYEQLGITNLGFEALDKRVTYSFILLNVLFYVLFETFKKASLGKFLLGGMLIDNISDAIDFSKALSRGLLGGFMMVAFYFLFHLAMGLNLVVVFCLFFLCMDLPVLFVKRSLLDICTRTYYVKRKTNTKF